MQRKPLTLARMSQQSVVDTRNEVMDLARAYGPRVFHAAQRIVGEPAAAEDIQQEVFLRLLEDLPSDIDSWPAFLTTMATRLAIDQLRKGSRRRRLLGIFARAESPRTPEELSQAGDLAPALRAALGTLSARESEAFSLRYLSEFSVKQVAEALDLTENNVSVVLHRARTKLARRLALTDQEVS